MKDLVRDDTNSLGDRTHKSKSALSRNKMKTDDPERYRIYLDKQKVRAKQRREELKRELQKKKGNEQSKAKKAHQNEMQRRRQKRYMERKKEQGISIQSSTPSTKAKPQTRNIIETRREYNRQKKIKERQEMSWQKKMWIRKKDRERKKKNRKEAAKLKEILSTSTGSPFASKKTEYNITSKVRKSIPKSPTKFAKVVDNLLSKASPRKVEALKQLKISKSTTSVQYARKVLAIKQVLKSSKASSVIVAEHLVKKYRAGHIAHKKGSIMKRKSHVDRNSIQTFFLREDISRVLPGKRYTTKDGPGYAMQVSLKAAHSKYLAENPTKRVSLGKFSALRTKNVRLLSVSDREFCCCVYCVNERYKMLCLSRAVVDKDKKKTCETDVLDIVLCPKRDGQRYHDPECINANCSDCMNYIDTLNQFYRTVPDDKQLTWTRWEYRETEKGKRKRVVVTKQGNKQACLEEFVENDLKRPVQAINYFQHIHTAHWQIAQFNQIKNQLPTCDILQVMDFAKNREIKYQDEIKGAFYTACQITMHPIITFYKADTGLVRNSSIVISEDNGHDYYAVQHFQEIVDIELEEKLGGCKPNRKVIFSDGCSCQYKSKGPFAELADSRDVINRNYYGSEHGKSECDAETGVVNRCIDRAIVANQTVINDAEDLYQYCKKNLELDSPFSKRTFHLVKLGEIDRERSGIMKAQTVQDTRKIHQVLNLQTRNTFKARNLSCFCIKCEAGNPNCLNSKYVNSYKETTLVEQTKSSKTQAGDESKKSTSEKPKAGKTRQSEENPKQGKTVKKSEEKPQTGKTRQSEEKPKKGETVKQSEEKPQTGKTRQSEEKAKKGKTVKQSDEKPQTGKTRGRSETSNAENERQQYFSSLLTIMELSGSEGFAKLKEVSSALHTEINEKYPLETVDGHFSFADGKYTADQIALTLIPEEIRTGGMLPVNVTADGNCLPRTGSILLFGNESAQEEMRVRIAIEQCLNSDLYIDNSYLNRGENFPEQESKFLDRTYTMFSEQYIPGNKVTKTDTENIFEEETVKICKRGSYMGIWQLFALSSVLKKKITSLYPIIGQSSVKQVLNRSILPRQGDLNEPSVTVMWTSTRTDMVPQHWIPNHFVPLLPTTRLSYFTEMMGDLSGMIDGFDFNEEDPDLSLDDSMMDTILTTLSSSIPTPDSTATPEGIEEITKTGEVAKWDDDTDLSGREIQSSNGTKDIDPTFTLDGTSTPDGTPTPEDTGPTPDGIPTPEDTVPTPDGTPTPEDTGPTLDGTPTPEDTKPTPDGTPTPEDTRPTPDGTPRPNQTEEITIAGGDDVDLPGREIQSRFRTGDYVLVQHGKCLLPAVVDSWPWVKFFSRRQKKGMWTLNEVQHTLVHQDIKCILQPPEIVMCGGTRLLYQFKDDFIQP